MSGSRVVVTGMGIVAPNAICLADFHEALLYGRSGIRFQPKLAELNFGCQVVGMPQLTEQHIAKYFTPLQLRKFDASGILYGVIAGKDAFADAGLKPADPEDADQNMGCIFGCGQSGGDKFREAIHLIDEGKVRRLGSNSVIQTMSSGVSAWLAGELGLGNQVTTNSSACSTGTEALIMAYERIKSGFAEKMLVGSTSDSGPYIWGGFDAMRVLPTQFNDSPEQASRPLSDDAAGFVPGSGSGALLLESLESAQNRGARIYCEVLGGAVNSGGQRGEGSMTSPNGKAVVRCIKTALDIAGVTPSQLDTINGHLTATAKDAYEIQNWVQALNLPTDRFPKINSFKSLLGHGLAASGSMELVGSILQIKHQVVYGNKNISKIHPEILSLIPRKSVPRDSQSAKINHVIKASFGFGDVNAVAVLKRFEQA